MRVKLSLLVLVTVIASALVDFRAATAQVSGGSGCFDCDDISIEDIGIALTRSFASTESDLLNRQAWAGTICDNHPCFNKFGEIGEEFARDLLFTVLAERKNYEDRWLTWVGTGIAAMSAFISLVALWQTYVATREARAASDRSIRNEARIEQLSEES